MGAGGASAGGRAPSAGAAFSGASSASTGGGPSVGPGSLKIAAAGKS
jgi:hypothetical protein